MAKILVVEDDKLIRDGVVGMIRSHSDHDVLFVENGKLGYETALAEKPDLIISDVHMPEMTGTEMAAKLREDKWGKQVPIIIMTNDEAAGTVNDALSAGVTSYLSKLTVDPIILMHQIELSLQQGLPA